MPYATRAELVDYAPAGTVIPDDPEATRKLTRASERIDLALISSVYDVDDDGLPTDAEVIAAMRDATCAQALWFMETGDETGAAGQYQTVSIGSVNLGRGNSGMSQSRGGQDLAPQADTHLRLAGLLPGSPYSC
jgi:hypothetical protein